jgi:hypothetical protein
MFIECFCNEKICLTTPTHLQAHLLFFIAHINAKKIKRASKPTHQDTSKIRRHRTTEKNNEPLTAPTQKAGFLASYDGFVVHQTLVFQIKFCGKSPALRVAAKR